MRFHCAFMMLMAFSTAMRAQTLPLPARPPDAPTGSALAASIESLSLAEREVRIRSEILAGNVPPFLRRLHPVNVTNVIGGHTNRATFFATPDYLAVGTDDDYLLTPLTPGTAQFLADQLAGTLPTRRMVEAIYARADLQLTPAPIPPSAAMTTVPVFRMHNDIVRTQRLAALGAPPWGALVAGHKKDVVITPRLATNAGKVAIYGWQRTNGQPIQPLYLGHTAAWVDYSHGIRLVAQHLLLNTRTTTVAQVLADPQFASVLSDEGAFSNPRYATNEVAFSPQRAEGSRVRGEYDIEPSEIKFGPGPFNERISEFQLDPDVRVQINAPGTIAAGAPLLLVLYALPNGNTIEQTAGRKLQPGDDWHFDIQHIAAQTRFVRAVLTNQTIVVAYLEATTKSWPTWRRQHGDAGLPRIVNAIKQRFASNQLHVVLSGHSGGGSFTFGYLNTQERIPEDVERIAFLDSNYAYEMTNHCAKLAAWVRPPPRVLAVLAYHDSIALLDGKTFVSERGGTWGRSHAMLGDLQASFAFTSVTNAAGLRRHLALAGRIQFLLLENPEKKILHTVQVERNGFIHALLLGTPWEGQGYDYLGERAYPRWIAAD